MAERSVEEMRADLAKNRAKMTGAIGDGKEAIRPQNIAREGIEQVKTFAKTEFDTATASLRDERGGWKLDKLLLVGGAVVGVIVFAVTLNQVATRRSLASAARKAIEK